MSLEQRTLFGSRDLTWLRHLGIDLGPVTALPLAFEPGLV